MIQIAFYKTKRETRGINVLRALGDIKVAKNGDIEGFIYNGVEYPIGDVVINRDLADGYNVFIKNNYTFRACFYASN